MSLNPVLAALVGLVVLDQHLDAAAWTAVGVVVGANTVAVTASSSGGRAAPVRAPGTRPARSWLSRARR